MSIYILSACVCVTLYVGTICMCLCHPVCGNYLHVSVSLCMWHVSVSLCMWELSACVCVGKNDRALLL